MILKKYRSIKIFRLNNALFSWMLINLKEAALTAFDNFSSLWHLFISICFIVFMIYYCPITLVLKGEIMWLTLLLWKLQLIISECTIITTVVWLLKVIKGVLHRYVKPIELIAHLIRTHN